MQWDHVSPEFAEASLAADRLPRGGARVSAHEAALSLAREHGSFAEEFVAREDLVTALQDVPADPATLTHVAWLRAALAPERGLEQDERARVLWALRSAVAVIETMPEVPLATWRAAVEDLETCLRADGHHLGPAHAARARLADAVDDAAGRDEALAVWLETPRGAQSDCAACEARGQALLTAETDPRRALDLLAPVVSGDGTCAEEPRLSLTHEAELRSALGDLDGAAASFRRSWDLLADDVSLAAAVARDLRVLVRMGNTDRAVDHVLARLDWMDRLRTAHDRMWFAATAAWVLRHGRRLGLAPAEVGGRPVAEVEAELGSLADDLARRFDQRVGTRVTGRRLERALDDSLVAPEPTLPPTHLPADAAAGGAALVPSGPDDVVAFAERALAARRQLDPSLEEAMRGWLTVREDLLPRLRSPEQWAAASSLDRGTCHLLRDTALERTRLGDALDLAERAGDLLGTLHARLDLAVLDVRDSLAAHGAGSPVTATARAAVRTLLVEAEEEDPETAATAGRWYVLTTAPEDGLARLRGCAATYGRLRLPRRRAMCLLDAVPFAHAADPAEALRLLDDAERLADGHPVLRTQAIELRARLAQAAGDRKGAMALHEQALAVEGSIDGGRMRVLLSLCDLLVDGGEWERLERRAADAVSLASRLREPVALAVAQRHLGLAWVEQGRPAEGAELLAAALPVVGEHLPALVGPTGWALGNASLALGSWARARTAFATASTAFEAEGRLRESGHAQYRAGNAAWDAGDTEAAAAHLDDAVDKARSTGTVDLLFGALRSRAALRATTGDLEAGLADLDAVIPEVDALAARSTDADPEEEFDGEVHEPDVLRQGAHLLAAAGRTDEAVARLARARALVGGDFEVVLRAEGAAVLAEADRLEEAEAGLRAALVELRAAGLRGERIEAGGTLARALDRAGRPEEARSVWDEFGADA